MQQLLTHDNGKAQQPSPAELEAAIVAQGAIAQALYRVGARTASVAAFCRLADLVAQRTPETVARMEAERGLA